jgi:aminopeptidase N
MEHYGCCFLHVQIDNDDLDSVQKDVLHEIAHQWIGNYIGMSLRMKEGIVQHIEKYLAEKLFASDPKKAKKKRQGGIKTLSSKSTADLLG